MKPEFNSHSAAAVRYLGSAALGGSVCFALCVLALHMLQPELPPLDEAMSYYVHGNHGWLITAALVSLGLGSLALAIAVAHTTRGLGARAGVACLAVWSICVLLAGVFPADPPGKWDKPPSVAGAIHGFAALAGLVVFPLAAVFISRALRHEIPRRTASRITMPLAIASAVSLVAFVASLTPALATSGPPVLLGLTERVMLGVYALWLAVVAASRSPRHPYRLSAA